jgi:hypothetical protein
MNGVDSTVVYVVDQFGAGISALAKSMQIPAAHVYEILVRQAVVAGLTELAWVVLGGIGVYVAARLIRAGVSCHQKQDDTFIPCFMFGGSLGVCSIVIVFHSLTNAILRLSNPEYYAIKEILKVLQ